MKVLGLDFETQGDDPVTTNVTEVGAILVEYDEDGIWTKRKELSEFCYEPEYPPQTAVISELTGITDEMLKAKGRPRREVFSESLLPLLHEADLVVAHKTHFDKVVLDSTCRYLGLPVQEKEWLCTLTDIPYPKRITCKKLSHVAYELGILVDPSTLHRALNDVDLMLKVLATFHFPSLLRYLKEPWVYLKGDVAAPWADGGVQNTIAKSLGFTWEKVRGVEDFHRPKTWVIRVKEKDVVDLEEQVRLSKSPFRVSIIQGM